jgi:Zn-dependent protease
MNGSILLLRLFKIPIKIHWTFSLLIVYVLGVSVYKDVAIEALGLHLAFILAIFVCVVLHELGHALAARYYNVETTEIILLPVGGVAMFNQSWITARQEFIIAFAGPLVNFSIAFLLWLGLFLFIPTSFEYIGVRDQVLSISNSFASRLMWINLLIGGFNLIPTLPLDGGVMLRSLLTIWTNRTMASKLSFIVSVCFSLGFVVYSYYFRAVEYLIFAWFIYFSARARK